MPTGIPEATGSPVHSKSYKWWVVVMLWFVCFFNYADRQAIFAVFPMLKNEFGFDKVQLGLIGSAFMWVYAFGAPFAGFVCDRFRRKDLILGGCIFWSCVTVATGWCSKLWHFVTVRALEGFAETFYFPASMSLVSDYHGVKTRSRAFSFHQTSVYAGTIGGGWIGAWFAEKHGWRIGFYFFGIAGVLLALFLYKVLQEPQRGAADISPGAESVKSSNSPTRPASALVTAHAIFRIPTVLLLMAAFVCANFVATIFLTWTPTFLVEKFGFKLTSAGLSGSVFIHLASLSSVPLGGMLADKMSLRRPGGRIMVQGAGLLLGSVFVFTVGTTSDVATLLAAMTLFGLCKGLYDSNIFAALYDFVDPSMRGSAAGWMNTVGWTGGALGPLFVGLASKYGNRPTEMENMSESIAWCGAIYLIGAAFLAVAMGKFAKRDFAVAKGNHALHDPEQFL